MDDEITAKEIIEYLYLRAGQLMEDNSVAAALRMPTSSDERQLRVQQLNVAGRDIHFLVGAAEVIARRRSI
jgi:hypothetical protein